MTDNRWDKEFPRLRGAEEPEPKITVSGNHIRVTRLDPEGNLVGPPLDLTSAMSRMSFDIDPADVDDFDLIGDELTLDLATDSTFTLDVTFLEPNPELLALLWGQPLWGQPLWGQPSPTPLPWWRRVLARTVVRWTRWLR